MVYFKTQQDFSHRFLHNMLVKFNQVSGEFDYSIRLNLTRVWAVVPQISKWIRIFLQFVQSFRCNLWPPINLLHQKVRMIRMQQKFDSKRYVKVQVKMSWSFESVYAKVIRLSYIQTLPIKLAPLIWMISSCYLWLIRQGLPVQLIYGSILMMRMFMNTRERNI